MCSLYVFRSLPPPPLFIKGVYVVQCCGSRSEWIRNEIASWIRISIQNADPEPG